MPLQLEDYERSPELTETEFHVIKRLAAALEDLEKLTRMPEGRAHGIRKLLVIEMARRGTNYWAWDEADWAEIICRNHDAFAERYHVIKGARLHLMAFAYAVGTLEQPRGAGDVFLPYLFARAAFGRESVDAAIRDCAAVLERGAIGKWFLIDRLQPGVSEVLIAARTPQLGDLTTEAVERAWNGTHRELRAVIVHISRVLTEMSIIPQPILGAFETPRGVAIDTTGAPDAWTKWARRWFETSTLEPRTREQYMRMLVRVGRWLQRTHPSVVEPAAWPRATAAACVAAIDRLRVGDWAGPDPCHLGRRFGKPLMPCAKVSYLRALRSFFRDCQEWEWCQPRFNPLRSFATPRSIGAQSRPDPRVVADDVWAKLLWAGLNLTEDDLPRGNAAIHRGHQYKYPLAMIRAVVLVWLFVGLRSDEIRRLSVGYVRRQNLGEATDPPAQSCVLRVPVNKTSIAFEKALDLAAGEAVQEWERVRPDQPLLTDVKTGERVRFLFMYRCQRIEKDYLNNSLIPALCRKAGIPERDARGDLTSHRARSTIASQLANARDPMSLFELMEWLGHKSPQSTVHYVKSSLANQVKQYEAAGYRDRNLRSIAVLVNRKGLHGAAEPHQGGIYYDLGHGYCRHEFFAQCPHRLACVRCPFYEPKDPQQLLILEAEGNLIRLRQDLYLTEEEQAVIDGDVVAYRALRERNWNVPTPAGPTPHQLAAAENT